MNNFLTASGYSTASIHIIQKSVTAFQNWCNTHQVEAETATYNDVLAFIQHIQSRNVKQRTVQLCLGNLSIYFNWLKEQQVRLDNPTEQIKVQGVKRGMLYHIITKEELERVYHGIEGNAAYLSGSYKLWEEQSHHSQLMHRIMYGLVIWQGVTAGELEALTVKDVQLREGVIHIPGARRSNARTLKLESVQILDMMEYQHTTREYYRKASGSTSDKLFLTRQGGSAKGISNRITALLQVVKAINPQITQLQQIRTSVITHWLKNHNLRQVQYMAGHRYVSSTENYLVNDLEDLKEDVNRFHPLRES
jgi:integrase/recombinase XerD